MAKLQAGVRLQNIDAVRGLVMVLMLLDHLRETWFVYVPVLDPIDVRSTLPAVAIARFLVSLCAPIFVALTGVGVFLFRSNHSLEETTSYLLKRGLLLMALDVFFLSELYWGITEPTLWLQVIWCIGVCMVVLAGLIRLPFRAILAIGLVIVCGHNLLDPIQLQPGDRLLPLWAEIHQRAQFELPFGVHVKTTYPVLAWIGVIALGYCAGSLFLPDVAPAVRRRQLLMLGFGMLAAFVALRFVNGYGDKPWSVVVGDPLRTDLGFYHSALAIWGPNHGNTFGVDSYGWVVVWYACLIVPLYIPTAWFSRLKRRRRDIAWLRYF